MMVIADIKKLNYLPDGITEIERHKKIEDYDRLKPATDIVTGFMVFPIIYYHSKHMQMERWLYE